LVNTGFYNYVYRVTLCIGNLKFGEMEFGEMKRNTSNWNNFACFRVARVCQRQLGFLVNNRRLRTV